MFERVYLGAAHPRRAHARAEAVRRIFDHLADRGDSPAEIVDYLSGMTDRFALEYAASCSGRIKDTSVEAVKATANIVDLVEARTRLRKVGGRYTGLCPFHQEKTPSFSVSPDRGTYHCFGCGVGGDSISFVREIEGLDFVGAIEWLADRFNVELEYEDSSPRPTRGAGASGCTRSSTRRRPSTRRRSGPSRASPCRSTSRREDWRGDVQGVPARALTAGGDALEEGAGEGLLARGAHGGRPRHAPRRRTTSSGG